MSAAPCEAGLLEGSRVQGAYKQQHHLRSPARDTSKLSNTTSNISPRGFRGLADESAHNA